MRKPGKSYYWQIFLVLVSINLYIVICFPKLDYKKNKYFDVLQINQSATVTSMTIINLIVYTFIFFIEYIFSKTQTHDLLGYRSLSTTSKFFEQNYQFNQLEFTRK